MRTRSWCKIKRLLVTDYLEFMLHQSSLLRFNCQRRDALMRLRLGLTILFLLLMGSTVYALPTCTQIKAQPNAWAAAQIDALVGAAHTFYEDDDAADAYKKVVNDIATALKQCNLSQEESFAGHYREFIDYVNA